MMLQTIFLLLSRKVFSFLISLLSQTYFVFWFLVFTDYEPQSICEHLQYLFALLQNSNRKYIDPSGLVKALGLDTGQQQVNPYIWLFMIWAKHNDSDTFFLKSWYLKEFSK